jgi:hypothetical protein
MESAPDILTAARAGRHATRRELKRVGVAQREEE